MHCILLQYTVPPKNSQLSQSYSWISLLVGPSIYNSDACFQISDETIFKINKHQFSSVRMTFLFINV